MIKYYKLSQSVMFEDYLINKISIIIIIMKSQKLMEQNEKDFFQHSLFDQNFPQKHQPFDYCQFFDFQLFSVDEKQDLGLSKEDAPTNDKISEDLQVQNDTETYMKLQNYFQPRCKEQIFISTVQKAEEITYSLQTKEKYHRILQGTKDDTVELNINFKTILVNHLKQFIFTNQLDQGQNNQILQFSKRSPSFESLSLFVTNNEYNRLNKIILNFIGSKQIIKEILKGRCRMINKIQMIKYVQVLRMNINNKGKITKWKDNYKNQILA